MVAENLRTWTREEYNRLVRSGFLHPDERLELVDGLIVKKMAPNPPHILVIDLIENWLRTIVEPSRYVRSEDPIALSPVSQPEPDLAVVRGGPREYGDRYPEPHEIELIVEVSDSSLERDRRFKTPLYAAAGIRELWIVDVASRKLEIHREPAPTGYRIVTILADTESASPFFSLETSVRISDLLPS